MIDNRQEDFSKYGKKFQENLVRLVLEDRVFADQMLEVLDINFLELKYLQVFVEKIFEYRHKYTSHPSHDTMTIILRSELDDVSDLLKNQVREYYAKILAGAADTDGLEHVKEVALDFCKKQKLKEAMLECVGLMQRSSYDEISSKINNALNLGTDNDLGYDYMVDFEKRFELIARAPVTTGWKYIDGITGGGLGKGELGVCVAPTGGGKSMVLTHLGAEALKAGKTVIHYTFELMDSVICRRYDSCLTEIELSSIIVNKDRVRKIVEEVPGRLIVKQYPTKSASTVTLKAHLEKLKRRGIDPDMIIVDYADLLKPVNREREKRNELESIYEELRAIAMEMECPIWTASQTNRSGLNAEIITMESISEAFNKCFVADFIFSVSRTPEDKISNEGRIFIAKNRNGQDGMVYPIFMDTSNVKIKVFAETVGEEKRDVAKSQQESLQERYKAFVKNKRNGVNNVR
jgi:replicative DNA helicase